MMRRPSAGQLAGLGSFEAALAGAASGSLASADTNAGFSGGTSLTHSFSAAFWLSPTTSNMAAHQQRAAQVAGRPFGQVGGMAPFPSDSWRIRCCALRSDANPAPCLPSVATA